MVISLVISKKNRSLNLKRGIGEDKKKKQRRKKQHEKYDLFI